MLITVPEAAKRVGRHPETIRRWIRAGRLRSEKVGTQHLVDESQVDDAAGYEPLDVPHEWTHFADGTPMPDWQRMVRRSRDRH
jgi:excisionase family DNA binding protein